MSLLKNISDKGAVLSWSPINSHSNLVALGTKDSSGISFDDYGGELEIHKLDFADTSKSSTEILGKAKTSSRFASIAWSEMATNPTEFPYGLIAGGMIDGSIHIWDSTKLVQNNSEPLLASVQQHQGAIHGLQFNPHKESSHLLASGGSDGEVFVMALDKPGTPNVFIPAPPPSNTRHSAEVTKVSWNSQVAHILASASQNGSTIIWDLRQKKAWCELREPTGSCVTDVAWNPDQGLHLVTASGDDKNPVIKLWDLRASTSLPLATLQGHTEGVLSVSWCPTDPTLLLSSGKDNRTILWDLFHLQPAYDLPSERIKPTGEPSEQGVFGGLASSAVQKRFHVSWSPCLPAVVAACSFDRRVQFYSLAGARSRLGRAPKWLRKPIGVSFGFGGKIAYFDNKSVAEGATSNSAVVRIVQREEDPTVGRSCDNFHAALASGDFRGFCDAKAADPMLGDQDRRVWGLMRVICFEKNAREELLTHLGFDNANIAAKAEEYVQGKRGLPPPPPPPPPMPVPLLSPLSSPSKALAESLFSAPLDIPIDMPPPPPAVPAPSSASASPEVTALAMEMAAAALAGTEAEPTIRQALVVGNFSAAVECCLEAGLLAEALLLAQCGDPSLCSRTQAAFFQRQKNKKPFLQILHAIIKGELMEMVQTSDLSRWKETLALLSTYGKSEEFPSLCETLAARLESEVGDVSSAALCYMCATNVERVVHFWAVELAAANAASGKLNSAALQVFVEKVVLYTHANPVDRLPVECSVCFSQYAALLAAQGRLDVAPKYLRGDTLEESILRDRIFHASAEQPTGARPPVFPFTRVDVKETVANAALSVTVPVQAASGGSMKVAHSPVRATTAPAPVPVPVAAAASTVPQLPPGWTKLLDPSSGRPYFVNQSTGQSQWEAPVPTPAPVPVVVPAAAPVAAAVTPVSKPVPYAPAARPIVAGAAQAPQAAPIGDVPSSASTATSWVPSAAARPVAAAPAVAPKPVVLMDVPVVGVLEDIVNALAASTTLTPGDRRQVSMVQSCVTVLRQSAGVGDVAVEVLDLLQQLVAALQSRNFTAANGVQTVLANTAWNQHKDWIKGVKVLIQILASKK